MTVDYSNWLGQVRSALDSINMPLEQWQQRWKYDFAAEFAAGARPAAAAERANRFWWHEQNKALKQDCQADAQLLVAARPSGNMSTGGVR